MNYEEEIKDIEKYIRMMEKKRDKAVGVDAYNINMIINYKKEQLKALRKEIK